MGDMFGLMATKKNAKDANLATIGKYGIEQGQWPRMTFERSRRTVKGQMWSMVTLWRKSRIMYPFRTDAASMAAENIVPLKYRRDVFSLWHQSSVAWTGHFFFAKCCSIASAKSGPRVALPPPPPPGEVGDRRWSLECEPVPWALGGRPARFDRFYPDDVHLSQNHCDSYPTPHSISHAMVRMGRLGFNRTKASKKYSHRGHLHFWVATWPREQGQSSTTKCHRN